MEIPFDPLPFDRLGPARPAGPVVIAVPHAGRHYPAALLETAVSRTALESIEDRLADMLVTQAVATGVTAFVGRHARGFIDLNRDPREIAPATIDGPLPERLIDSDKVRGGLGLIPHRTIGGALLRHPLPLAEIDARIAAVHAPYHAAIAAALDLARRDHGVAILIDCHSMPPLSRPPAGGAPARIVIGDQFGQSAGATIVDRIEAVVRAHSLAVARNSPYSGGYTLDRHGRPAERRHAVQIEFDRSLYLDARLRLPGPGLGAMQALLAGIVAALAADADRGALPIAAE